jgi:zinc protease
MIDMKFLLPFIFIFAFIFSAYSQSNAPGTESSITEFDVNGLKVVFKRRSSSPTVSTGLFFRGGARNETVDNAGIEGLTLDAATEGSKKFPRDMLRRELARTGTAIGSASSYDYSAISMVSTSEFFDRSWEILTDLVLNPTFAADDVEREKSAMIAGLKNESASPDSALDALEEKIIYAGHPYAANPTGSIETVSKLTPEALRAYHKGLLQTSRMLLVVVGDTDVNQIKKLVTASFANLPRGDYKDSALPKLQFTQPTLDITPRQLNTNYIKGVFQAPSISDPDYYAMRVAISILQRNVYQEVRLKRNLSYAPNASMDNRAANSAEIYVTAVDANQAIKVMLNEIEKLRQGPIDSDEFVGVPGYFLTTYYVDQETNAAQAGELARYELIGGGWRNSLNFLNGIANVTPQDVYNASVKYMKNIRFVVVGDPKAIDRSVFLASAHS